MNLQTKEKKFLVPGEDPEDLQVSQTKDEYIFDARGKRYIDFSVGWCVGNLGWGMDEITAAVNRRTPVYISPLHRYKRWAELAELLASIAPGNLQRSIRTTGGTEAVEAAMQVAMLCTGRSKFLSIEGSYHGNSIAAMSIGSSEYREQFKNLLPNCMKIEPPLDRKAIDKVETRLKKRDVAAFIMEPIICNLGIMIPEHAFMKGVGELCKKYGTLLVMDEVACGFGRTGKLFASEHFEIEPDILCAAKAITGGYAPMGACITTAAVAEKALKNDFNFYSSYGWHPLAVEAAIANVRYWIKNKNKILKNVTELSQCFTDRLTNMKFKKPHTIRIMGLAIGVDVGNKDYAERIQQKCLKQGLLFSTEEKTLTLFPALTMRRSVAEQGLDILQQCI